MKDFFDVLRVSRDDVESVGFKGQDLTDEQMERIAFLMHNNNECIMDAYWEALRNACKIENIEKQEQDDDRDPMLDYVKSHLEAWERGQGYGCIINETRFPDRLINTIHDLCEEWCEDNDEPEGSWLNTYYGEEDVFRQM